MAEPPGGRRSGSGPEAGAQAPARRAAAAVVDSRASTPRTPRRTSHATSYRPAPVLTLKQPRLGRRRPVGASGRHPDGVDKRSETVELRGEKRARRLEDLIRTAQLPDLEHHPHGSLP